MSCQWNNLNAIQKLYMDSSVPKLDAIDVILAQSQAARFQHKMGDLYVKAANIGRRAHKDQKRWGGGDYFEEHCVKVADLCESYTAAVTALMHDIKEDKPEFWPEVLAAGFPPLIITALEFLYHDLNDTYAQYIEKLSKHQLASYVKLKDLEHNLSDLEGPRNQQRRDKYELASLFLRTKWNL